MQNVITNSGPFGRYERGSAGHVLNALAAHGVPIHIAEEAGFSNGSTLMYCGKEFCKYKYFDGIDQPLFRFENQTYEQQRFVVDPEKRVRKPAFRLGLSVQDTPGLTINGPDASVELHEFIRCQCLTNYMDAPGYKLSQESGAFFQGGAHDPEGQWIFIEFWKPKGAQVFVDFINNNYIVSMDPPSV
jgi:hypothetical protein